MGKPKFYAVANGRNVGIFQDWSTTQTSVSGYSGAKFKSFGSMSEAQAYMSQNSSGSSSSSYAPRASYSSPSYSYSDSPSSSSHHYGSNYGSSASSSSHSSGNAPASRPSSHTASSGPSYASSSSTSRSPTQRGTGHGAATRTDPYSSSSRSAHYTPSIEAYSSWSQSTISSERYATAPREKTVVYADGACRGNGRGAGSSSAGVGVFFGNNDARNISEPLSGEKQTNQRAELTAVLRAMQTVPHDEPLEIRSDSKYAVDGMNSWIDKWGDNAAKWGKVENADLFQQLRDERGKRSADTTIVHVPAHSGIHGNEAADRLAVAGSLRHSKGK